MSNTAITIPAPQPVPTSAPAWPGLSLWHEKSGFGFHDLLDVINPLQHIPVIGTLYRHLTGDEPGALSRIAGDGLFGGLFGLIGGLVNVLVQAESGKDIGDHVLATIGLDGDDSASSHAAATADPTARGFAKAPMPLSSSRILAPTSAAAANAAAAAPTRNPGGPQLSSHPVPLQSTGLLLPTARPRPLITLPEGAGPGSIAAIAPDAAKPDPAKTPSVTAGSAAAGTATAATIAPVNLLAPAAARPAVAAPVVARAAVAGPDMAAVTAGPPAAPSAAVPVDISARMSDALDKYARLLKQQRGQPGAGQQVDLTQ